MQNTAKQNYLGSVTFYDTRPGKTYIHISHYTQRKHMLSEVICSNTRWLNVTSTYLGFILCYLWSVMWQQAVSLRCNGCLRHQQVLDIILFVLPKHRQHSIRMTSQWKTRKSSCRWQTCVTRKHAKIAPIQRAFNVVADNTGLSSFV